MSSCGPAGQRHRDHHALLLAAGQLVRVGLRAAARAARPGRAARPPACRPSPGSDLLSCSRIGSAICRPTRCTGLSECSAPWKTIDGLAPAHRAQPPELHLQHVLAVEQDLAGRPSPTAGSRRSTVAASVDLPQPDSPATPSDRAGVDGQGHAAHGRHRTLAASGRSPTRSSSSRSRRHGSALPRCRGSTTTSSARPTRVNASTTTTTQRPGGSSYHQAPCEMRAVAEGVVEHRAPARSWQRVAEAEEGTASSRTGSRRRRSASCWRAPAA